MADQDAWDSKLKGFLKRAQEDFKRAGSDLKDEAQRLLKEVQDPEKQAKVREGLKDFGVWARKTAEDVASSVEGGLKKAEGSSRQWAAKITEKLEPDPVPPPAPTPRDAAPPVHDEAPPPPKAEKTEKAEKTIGPKPGKKKAAGAPKTAKKTIGRAPSDTDEDDDGE